MVEDISGRYVIRSLDDLQQLAQHVADNVEAGDILLLEGDLGAGKTAFVKVLAQMLQVGGEVTSPTFTVAAEYDVPSSHVLDQLVHIDLYRLGESADGLIGGEEAHMVAEMLMMAKQEKRLVVVEWADKLPNVSKEEPWRKRAWRMRFDYGERETERVVVVEKVTDSPKPPRSRPSEASRYPSV